MYRNRRELAAITGSALLLNLAFPPFHLLVPSLVCLVPAIVTLERGNRDGSPARLQFRLGFWFGLVANALLLHWMAAALWRYQPWWILAFAAVVLWLASMCGAVFAAAGWLCRRTRLSVVVVFPVVWTAVEWLLAQQGPLAFTWLGLGTSLTGFPRLVQLADLAGARGVTFLLAMANAALAVAWIQRRSHSRAARLVACVAIGGCAAWLYGGIRMGQLELRNMARVLVVQTAIPSHDKWSPGRSELVVGQALELTRRALAQRPDLIVWPETALPGALLYHPEWEQAVGELARRASAYLVVGGIDAVPSGRGLQQYNAAFLFDPGGRQTRAPYRKQRPVPLFEWGNGIMAGHRTMPYQTRGGGIGILICYEGTSEAMARQYRREGAGALVNLSNDAWFSAGTGAYQHAAHLVMRAIETRMGIARATNRGLSELVDPLGRIQQQLAPGTAGALSGSLGSTATIPLYVRLGDWVGQLSFGIALLLLGATLVCSVRDGKHSAPRTTS